MNEMETHGFNEHQFVTLLLIDWGESLETSYACLIGLFLLHTCREGLDGYSTVDANILQHIL